MLAGAEPLDTFNGFNEEFDDDAAAKNARTSIAFALSDMVEIWGLKGRRNGGLF